MKTKPIKLGTLEIGGGAPLVFIAGPCVIESRRACLHLAARLVEMARAEDLPLVFKASFDKANRTSHAAFRGPGLDAGLAILAEIRERWSVPVLTDVHTEAQAARAAEVVDILQVPAFLCRQTDLLTAAARTGRVVNVKKGPFMAPADMRHVAQKILQAGNRRILLTERGVSFGYHNLVVDLRSLPVMRDLGFPVVFDATHSVQRPGAADGCSGGDGCWAPLLARAAVAAGCDAVFMEVHRMPRQARSDGQNAIALHTVAALWRMLRAIDRLVRNGPRETASP